MTTTTKPKLTSKSCIKCGTYLTGNSYYQTNSPFFPDHLLSICKVCLAEVVDIDDWASMDKFCQWADYPFYPDVWTKLSVELGAKAFDAYIKGYCANTPLTSINWKPVQDEWAKLLKTGEYKDRIPVISEAKLADLKHEWGEKYSLDEYEYLDKFYKGLCTSHNIITELQRDAARTLAKLSVRISQKISTGDDVDKDISSYDKLMKSGGFTTENVRNMSDFESIGELVSYLEKTGWRNPYYDGAPKDVVDTTMSNMQKYVHRLIMGESSLKDQVEQRLTTLGINGIGSLDLSDEELDKYDDDSFSFVEAVANDEDENGEMNDE
jgi:hypothetical protein